MYVYGVFANLEDYFGNTLVLNSLQPNEKEANIALVAERKHYAKDTLLEVKRFRVNKKDEFFVVVDEQEDAGVMFNHFLHLTTTEKRANGWKMNFENRNLGSKLKVLKYVL